MPDTYRRTLCWAPLWNGAPHGIGLEHLLLGDDTFPMRRAALAVGQRREFLMAWVLAPELTVQAQPQAYTRIGDRQFLFENLDGSGFRAGLRVDDDGFVVDYPGLFRRIA